MDYNLPLPGIIRPAGGMAITVVTNNLGELKQDGLDRFITAVRPDLIVLQDAVNFGWRYGEKFSDYYTATKHEFALLSKNPITDYRWFHLHGGTEKKLIGATFETSLHGQPVIIYNIRLPTPRFDFIHLFDGILNRDKIGVADRINQYKESLAVRMEIANNLLKLLEHEKRLFLAVGDFNIPNHGYLYSLFSERLCDAFERTGYGYGATFPSLDQSVFSIFGPWLRLDYIFCGHGLLPVSSRREARRHTEHLAVTGRLIIDR